MQFQKSFFVSHNGCERTGGAKRRPCAALCWSLLFGFWYLSRQSTSPDVALIKGWQRGSGLNHLHIHCLYGVETWPSLSFQLFTRFSDIPFNELSIHIFTLLASSFTWLALPYFWTKYRMKMLPRPTCGRNPSFCHPSSTKARSTPQAIKARENRLPRIRNSILWNEVMGCCLAILSLCFVLSNK